MLISSIGLSVSAQDVNQKWALWLGTGCLEYKGELGDQFLTYEDAKLGFTGAITRYLNKSFDAGFELGYHLIDESGGAQDRWQIFGSVLSTTANMYYKLNNGYLLSQNSIIQPYLKVGVGAMTAFTKGVSADNNKPYNHTKPALALTYGFGAKVRISERLDFFGEISDNLISSDEFDASTSTPRNDSFRKISFGLIFRFGKPKDDDKDGVPNRKDECPDTPLGAKVDEKGCPIDTDLDGVIDFYDECVDVPGVKELKGCPDADGDGVKDEDDKCPETPEGVKVDENGCPDTDNDGVKDENDECPNTPEGTKVNAQGCPDSDGDGVKDSEDKCPDTEEGVKVDQRGCPTDSEKEIDSDSETYIEADIIIEPNTRLHDYPELMEKFQPVYFKTNSAAIEVSEIKKLTKMVALMKKYPIIKNVLLSGHADPRGEENYNMKLSERRALAVQNYMLTHKVEKKRVIIKAFGEAMPVSKKIGAKAYKKDRRVEFELND